jgi:hypothetical protein
VNLFFDRCTVHVDSINLWAPVQTPRTHRGSFAGLLRGPGPALNRVAPAAAIQDERAIDAMSMVATSDPVRREHAALRLLSATAALVHENPLLRRSHIRAAHPPRSNRWVRNPVCIRTSAGDAGHAPATARRYADDERVPAIRTPAQCCLHLERET